MKTILFSLAFFCYTSLIAQEKEVESSMEKQSKWTFGWAYSPEVSYRILSGGSEADSNTTQEINDKNNDERVKFGQNGSLFVGYKLSSILTLEGGIGYTNFGTSTNPKDVHYIATDNFPELVYTTYWINQFHLISLPINLHANFGQNRLRGFFSAGIAPGYLCYSSYTTHREYENGDKTKKVVSTNHLGDFSKFILVAQISGGIDFQLSSKATLRIAPEFRITTNSIFTDKKIRGNYFNAGIETSMVYKL